MRRRQPERPLARCLSSVCRLASGRVLLRRAHRHHRRGAHRLGALPRRRVLGDLPLGGGKLDFAASWIEVNPIMKV